MFPSHTKAFKHFVGVDMLREVAAMIQIPSFAIGGIDSSKLEQIIDSGFYRVAVSNAVHAAPSNEDCERNQAGSRGGCFDFHRRPKVV